jgi:hypothetical protein
MKSALKNGALKRYVTIAAGIIPALMLFLYLNVFFGSDSVFQRYAHRPKK